MALAHSLMMAQPLMTVMAHHSDWCLQKLQDETEAFLRVPLSSRSQHCYARNKSGEANDRKTQWSVERVGRGSARFSPRQHL